MKNLFLVFLFSLSFATSVFAQQYQVFPGTGDAHWMAPVSAVGTLPAAGNNVGDFRVETTAFNTYVWNGAAWACTSCAAGGGTVTSVSVAAANGFDGTVANATTTPAITIKTTVNGMTKGNGTALSAATSGTDYSAGTSALATGILKSTTATGVLSIAAAGTDYQSPISTSASVAHQFLTAFTAPNTISRAQPACSDLSDGVASCSTDTTNAANISSGLLALARGGNHADLSATGGAHQVLRQSGAGADVTVSQLACSDLSNGVASCSTDTTNAANISSGLLALARGGTHADLSATGGAHQFLKQSGAGADVTVGAIGLADLPSIQYPQQFWADGQLGSDANDGSYQHPWQTLSHACASIAPIIPDPTLLNLTGASDSSAGAITCPANIILSAHDPQYQITQSVTITGTIGNDTFSAINVTFLGGLSFTKNTATVDSIFLNNVDVISGPVLKQNGAGGFIIFANNLVANALDVKPGPSGIAIFNNPYFSGVTTFEDATNASYYQFQGGYIDSAMSIAGGPFVYFSGLMFDTAGGATLTTSATANGSPTIQSDDSSIPGSITGPNTLVLQSHSQHTEYTPTTAGDWSSVPATVLAALDNLASTGVYKSQAANKFFASPNGAPGPMSPRSIVAADVPTLNQNTTGTAANLSGTPALPNGTTATTQAPGDNSTKLATTAYADAAAAGGGISSLNTDVVAAGPGAAVATIQPGVVTNAKMANMAANTIKGNNTGGALAPIDLSIAQVNTMLGTVTSLTGEATGSGPGATAVTLSNAAVIGKVLTGFVSGAGVVAATDTILQAFNKLVGNVATKGCKWNIVTKTANYTAVACDVILADATGGAFTITIPLAGSATTADEIKVKKIDSSANAVAVTASGADNVEYLATQSLSTQGDAVDLHPDGGTNWYAF